MNANIKISIGEFEAKKSRDMIPLECTQCHGIFHREKHYVQSKEYLFCGRKCQGLSRQKRIKCNCKTCGKELIRWPSDVKNKTNLYCSKKCLTFTIKTKCLQCGKDIVKSPCKIQKSGKVFCNKVCSGIYVATHKTGGTRRSKLEKWIEAELINKYPSLEIHYNKTDAIDAELDIYIPSVKLAFELNGIFHYEDIYGQLNRTQLNDTKKFQLCIAKGISLCVIDTHDHRYHKKERDQKFLDIITTIIDKKHLQSAN